MNSTTIKIPPDENELITKLMRGDDQAFRQLIAQHHSLMLSIARAIAGDTFADDVVQEAWVSVYKNIASFERRSSLKTWLLTIVSNQAKARLRKESRQVSLDQLDGEVPGSYLDGAHFKADGHWQQPIPQWNTESPEALYQPHTQSLASRTKSRIYIARHRTTIIRRYLQDPHRERCERTCVSASRQTDTYAGDRPLSGDWLMLSCKQVAAVASDYLDNNTPLKWQIRLHLLMCANCRRFVRHLKITRDISAKIVGEDASVNTDVIWKNLQAQLKKEKLPDKE
jgi:RNA polymerase sigma-70 factor (ECF subfamily)